MQITLTTNVFVFSLIGFFLGLYVASLFYRKKSLQDVILRNQLALENEKLKQSLSFSQTQEKLMERFQQNLASSSRDFIKEIKEETKQYFSEKSDSIEAVLVPVQTTLTAFKHNLDAFEEKHAEDRGALKEQIAHLLTAEKKLEKETQTLTDILKHPGSRGRWGEIQLERILELSGLLKYCDYNTQTTDKEGLARADVIVRLPHNRSLVIDAKTPLSNAYFANTEEDKLDLILKVKSHIKTLKTKSYWDKTEHSPEFVILFLPGEGLFSDTIRLAPELFELAANSNVILCGPLTLLALLKTVAHTWKQENIQRQIQEIGLLGKELHQRLSNMCAHFSKVGNSLSLSVQHYNRLISSLQQRVFPTLRKFERLEITSPSQTIDAPLVIEETPTNIKEEVPS